MFETMFNFDMIQSGLVILVILALGEFVSKKTGAALPAILVSGLLYLALLWCGVIPDNLPAVSGYTSMLSIAICLVVLGMGTSTNFNELKMNRKTVALAASVFLVQLAGILAVITLIYGWNTALGCLPGGSNVSLMVQQRAMELGHEEIAVLAAMLFAFKALVSGPIVGVLIRKEVRKQLAEQIICERENTSGTAANGEPDIVRQDVSTGCKRIMSRIFYKGPCRDDESFYITLLRMYFVCFIASRIEMITGVSKYVFCLLLGILMTELGFLHRNDLERSGIKNFMMLILMTAVLNGFSTATPGLLFQLCVPMIAAMGTEAVSIFIASRIIGKAMGVSPYLASAIGYQGMMGFPLNLMISQDVIQSLTEDKAIRARLNASISTRVVLAGFTNTTILSVIAAGLLIGFMK